MTEDEFAKILKEKYPQYSSISDKKLVKKVLDKYPTYKDRVELKPGVGKQVATFGKELAKDAFKTLVVRPGARATEAITRTLAPNSLAAKGYEAMEDSGESQRLLGVDVERQKAFGQGGGKQIAGNALETAGWLYGTGKVANLAMKKAAETSTKRFLGQMAKEGFVGAGLGSAGQQLSNTGKVSPLKTIQDAAIGGVTAPVLGYGLNKLLSKKASKVADEVVTPKAEPSNLIEIGDRKFKVDEPTFTQYKQQEQKTLSKIDELNKRVEDPNIDQQKLDYYSKQIRDEQSKLDKYKRDITGDYTASELKTLVGKDRREFAKQGLPDNRTDDEIIDSITKKRVEYNPDLEDTIPFKETPTPKTVESIDTLTTEAKKYKSAEEFVKAQMEDTRSIFIGKNNKLGQNIKRIKPEQSINDVKIKKIQDYFSGLGEENARKEIKQIENSFIRKYSKGDINEGDGLELFQMMKYPKEIKHLAKTELDRIKNIQQGVRGFSGLKLTDFYSENSDLFKAYPQLKDLRIVIDPHQSDFVGGVTGVFGDGIRINPKTLLDKEKLIKNIRHEIQHIIQDFEGWERGTTINNAGSKDNYLNHFGEIQARNELYKYNNYDDIIFTKKDSKASVKKYWDDAIKTKSQLTDIWNKANQATPEVATPEIPTQTTSGQVVKRGSIAQQEDIFKNRFNEKGEDYWRDVAAKRIEDPDVSPQIAYKQLEMKYDIDGNKQKLFELFQEASEKTSTEQGRGLSYLNSGEASFGPLTSLQKAQSVLDDKLKRMKVDINPEVEDGIQRVLKDVNSGRNVNEAIDSFIDFITCK